MIQRFRKQTSAIIFLTVSFCGKQKGQQSLLRAYYSLFLEPMSNKRASDNYSAFRQNIQPRQFFVANVLNEQLPFPVFPPTPESQPEMFADLFYFTEHRIRTVFFLWVSLLVQHSYNFDSITSKTPLLFFELFHLKLNFLSLLFICLFFRHEQCLAQFDSPDLHQCLTAVLAGLLIRDNIFNLVIINRTTSLAAPLAIFSDFHLFGSTPSPQKIVASFLGFIIYSVQLLNQNCSLGLRSLQSGQADPAHFYIALTLCFHRADSALNRGPCGCCLTQQVQQSDHFLRGSLPTQSRQAAADTRKEWTIVTLISYLIFSKISNRFWITIITQHTTIIDRRALLLFHSVFSFACSSRTIQPKYWHSFINRILFSSDAMNRFAPKNSSSMYQKSSLEGSQVRLKTKRLAGVTNLANTLLESTLMSSLSPLFENQFMKRAMMTMKCMATRKACRFWLSMTSLTRRKERSRTQRQERQRMQLTMGERCRGSSSQQQRQVRSSLSKRRKSRQQLSILGWQCSECTTEQKRQRQYPKSSHQKTSMRCTLCALRGCLLVMTDTHCGGSY